MRASPPSRLPSLRRALLLALLLPACAAGSGGPAASSPGPTATTASSAPGPATHVGPALGTVHSNGGEVWYVVPDDDAGARYCLDGSRPVLQVEDQRVRFEGTPGEIPPNVRMMCTPFTFTLFEPAA